MNIFVLDLEPRLAAQYQADKHVVKMVLETAQLLCSVFEPGVAPYKRTHYNHPCAKWTRESMGNMDWLYSHGIGLLHEYEYRYKRVHKCDEIYRWLGDNRHGKLIKPFVPDEPQTPFTLAMPEEYKNPDPVVAYRAYYMGAKRDIVAWNNGRSKPSWYT